MRFTIAAALLCVSFVAAQTETTTAADSGSTCAAQNIVDACLPGLQAQVNDCAPNDWKCMCDAQTSLLTCYNNCPSDPARVAAQQQQESWCNAAGLVSSQSAALASETATGSMTTSVAPTALTTTSSASEGSATGSSTKTASGSSSSHTGAAGNVVIPVGGVFAAVLAVAGLL